MHGNPIELHENLCDTPTLSPGSIGLIRQKMALGLGAIDPLGLM